MSKKSISETDPRIKKALAELRGLIRERYPDSTFEVSRGEDDPQGIHLTTTVDVEDTEEVLGLVIDRVLELQLEDGLPVHVIPLRPLERVIQELKTKRSRPKAAMETNLPLHP